MSDQPNMDDFDADLPKPDEMTTLRERAQSLGLRVSPNIGLDTLRTKVNAAMTGKTDATAENEGETQSEKELTRHELRAKMRREQLRLVRVRISCMNPKKKDLNGEFFTVANKVIGEVKKFIPYGEVTDEGYHIPFILLKQLKERQFLHVKSTRNRVTGQYDVSQRWVKEFSIDELPALTREELKDLAAAQAAAGGVG